MNARAVVESALQAMIQQDIEEHMRWIDDNVRIESQPTQTLMSKLRYLQEFSLVLAPGTGSRVSRYVIEDVGELGPDGQWIKAVLTIEVPRDGKPFPTGPVQHLTQRSEAWYAVRDDRIVQVRTASLPQASTISWG